MARFKSNSTARMALSPAVSLEEGAGEKAEKTEKGAA